MKNIVVVIIKETVERKLFGSIVKCLALFYW